MLRIHGIVLSGFILISLYVLLTASCTEALDIRDFYPPFWAPDGKQFLNADTPLGEPLNVSQ